MYLRNNDYSEGSSSTIRQSFVQYAWLSHMILPVYLAIDRLDPASLDDIGAATILVCHEIPQGIGHSDNEGKITYINDGACRSCVRRRQGGRLAQPVNYELCGVMKG